MSVEAKTKRCCRALYGHSESCRHACPVCKGHGSVSSPHPLRNNLVGCVNCNATGRSPESNPEGPYERECFGCGRREACPPDYELPVGWVLWGGEDPACPACANPPEPEDRA